MQTDLMFGLVILIISVILHEVAHGYMANWLGDPTARLQGRLTLNPLVHVDPVGSLLLPFLLIVTGSPILVGYAKPVPYNPYNLSGKYDEALVAFAGPGTNILLALIFGLIIRFAGAALSGAMLVALASIVWINMMLALFNLVPLPFLDGSKVLSGMLSAISPNASRAWDRFKGSFERFGIFSGTLLFLLVIYLFSPYFTMALGFLFEIITGLPM